MAQIIDIRFEGDKFLPSKLKEITNLPIETLVEYNTISNIGRYKGQLSPYGIALLKIENLDVLKNTLDELIELSNSAKWNEINIDEIIICISDASVFDIQCIEKISELNTSIELTQNDKTLKYKILSF